MPCCSYVALGHFLLCLPPADLPHNPVELCLSVAEVFVLSHLQARTHRGDSSVSGPVLSVIPLTKGQPRLAYPRASPSTQNVPLPLQMAELLTGLCVSFHFPFSSLSRSFPVQGLGSFFPQLCTWLLCLRRCLFAGQLLSFLA